MFDVRELVRGSPSYPEELARLAGPPVTVRLVGPLPPRPRVALVGTRNADPEALEFARGLAADLSRAGVCIVSGGAVGIDTAAHEGALDARGTTLVVLPTGFHPAYPRGAEALLGRVVRAGGALLTEMPDGYPPRPHTFLRRNGLVAALSDAVVVVQAPARSGALSTAAWAEELRVPVFAVPHSPWDFRGIGGVGALLRGARVCVGAQDVLLVTPPGVPINGIPEAPPQVVAGSVELDGDERSVWLVLGSRPRHPDELLRLTGLPVERVHRALLGLLLEGRIDERDGGRYVRAPRLR